MNYNYRSALALAVIVVSLTGWLGTAGADAPKPPAWYDTIQASGFVDAYYQANFNGLSAGPGANSGNINVPGALDTRAFDQRQNEFTFNGFKLALTANDPVSKVGAEADILLGPLGALSTGVPALQDFLEQAFVTYNLGPVGIKFGKMVTHMGFEVIDTPANWNYSRSILFNEVPLYHVGVMANYAPCAGWNVMIGAANSNSFDQANDEAKDYLAQVVYSAMAGLSLTGNYYLESNRTAAGLKPFENTHYLELVGTYQASPDWNFGLDYLYRTTIASSDKINGNATGDSRLDPATGKLAPFSPKGQGYALYVGYATPLAGLSIIPRFEQWYAPDAVPSSSFANDYTLTLKYAAGRLTHYLEFRADVQGPAGFYPSQSQDLTKLKTQQQTLTYAVTYSF